MTSSVFATMSTDVPIGPTWSMLRSSGTTPVYGTRPWVGLMPTSPHHELGILTDPAWSVPRATSQSPFAGAAPDPLDDPPARWSAECGFVTGP